jgi:hypothetical protein
LSRKNYSKPQRGTVTLKLRRLSRLVTTPHIERHLVGRFHEILTEVAVIFSLFNSHSRAV